MCKKKTLFRISENSFLLMYKDHSINKENLKKKKKKQNSFLEFVFINVNSALFRIDFK